jgi:hypothetical protein
MAVVHSRWGERHPEGGPGAFFIILVFWGIGFIAAAGFFSLSTISHSFLRGFNLRRSLCLDLLVFSVLAAVLAYAGLTATYYDAKEVAVEKSANHAFQRTPAAPRSITPA